MVCASKMPARFDTESEGSERRMFPRREFTHTLKACGASITRSPLIVSRISHWPCATCRSGARRHQPDAAAAGERLAVFFPPQGIKRGWDAYGRVIRCNPSAMGYRIAVEFDPIPAAA